MMLNMSIIVNAGKQMNLKSQMIEDNEMSLSKLRPSYR